MTLKAFCDIELRWVDFTIERQIGSDSYIINITEGDTLTRQMVHKSVIESAVDSGVNTTNMERRSFHTEKVITECDCCGADGYDYVTKSVTDKNGEWVSARKAITRIAELEQLLIANNIDLPN